MLRLSELRLPLEHGSNDLQEAVLRRLRIPPDQLLDQRLVKRSIDARRRESRKKVPKVRKTIWKLEGLN